MDAAALIEAIKANPKEDAPRLMYCDWLGEFADPNDDQAKATRKFIQISCAVGRISNTMPMPAYEWLENNWQRLIPKTMALHVPYRKGEIIPIPGHRSLTADGLFPPYKRAGRKVWCRINLQGKASTFVRRTDPAAATVTPARVYSCSMWFTFWKGFCVECEMFSQWGSGIVFPVIGSESPILKTMVPHA